MTVIEFRGPARPTGSAAGDALRSIAAAIEYGEYGDPSQIEVVAVLHGQDGTKVAGAVGSFGALGAYYLLGRGMRAIEGGS